MFFFETEVLPSSISGKGVFSRVFIPKKSIVGYLAHNCIICDENTYQKYQLEGNISAIQTGIRLIDSIFIFNELLEDGDFGKEEYLNHSSMPNTLYHCGFLFANRDIVPGEEITVDYKYLMALDDVSSFEDVITGKLVTGIKGDEALLQSSLELVELLS